MALDGLGARHGSWRVLSLQHLTAIATLLWFFCSLPHCCLLADNIGDNISSRCIFLVFFFLRVVLLPLLWQLLQACPMLLCRTEHIRLALLGLPLLLPCLGLLAMPAGLACSDSAATTTTDNCTATMTSAAAAAAAAPAPPTATTAAAAAAATPATTTTTTTTTPAAAAAAAAAITAATTTTTAATTAALVLLHAA